MLVKESGTVDNGLSCHQRMFPELLFNLTSGCSPALLHRFVIANAFLTSRFAKLVDVELVAFLLDKCDEAGQCRILSCCNVLLYGTHFQSLPDC